MSGEDLLNDPKYDPNGLLDSILKTKSLKNDAALARLLEVAPPVISKIRHRKLPVGASLLIRMHEVTDLTIAELRLLMGDRRGKFRVGAGLFNSGSDKSGSDITGVEQEN